MLLRLYNQCHLHITAEGGSCHAAVFESRIGDAGPSMLNDIRSSASGAIPYLNIAAVALWSFWK